MTLGLRSPSWLVSLLAACIFTTSAARAQGQPDFNACFGAATDGQTFRDAGSYQKARDKFVACAAEECPGEVRKRCVAWLDDIEKRMPTVVFAAQSHGKDVANVRVRVDDVIVAERVDGKPVSIDPGEHHFRFERDPPPESAEITSVVRAGEKERIIAVRFGPEIEPTAPAPPARAQTLAAGEFALSAIAIVSVAVGAALDISGYVFLNECNGDPTCGRAHEIAEVKWRFYAGDILLGAGLVSGIAAWLLRPHDAATPRAARWIVQPSGNGARGFLTVRF